MLDKLYSLCKEKSHLIFDFDRTLAKIEINWDDWLPGIANVYAKFDINHGFEYGKNPHEYGNRLVAKHGSALRKAVNAFNQAYEAEYLIGFTPYQELLDLISGLKDKTLYVYSSNSRATVLGGLEEMGIIDRFKQIITGDDVTYVKPNPEGFKLIDGLEGNENSFLMIGDSNADRKAAAAAGIDFFECNYFKKYRFG